MDDTRGPWGVMHSEVYWPESRGIVGYLVGNNIGKVVGYDVGEVVDTSICNVVDDITM